MTTIKMTQSIINYCQAIAKVGERMSVTANKFGEASKSKLDSKEDIEGLKGVYYSLNDEFKMQYGTLERLKVPNELSSFHTLLLGSYWNYVQATEVVISSLDVGKGEVNQSEYDRGILLQAESSKEIVKLTEDLARQLGLKK